MSRKTTGARLRFEVFKRDGFKCVYCGTTPAQGPLHVDHVVAVADGGSDLASNLVTACATCNLGKSDVPLDRRAIQAPDDGRIADQAEHLEQLKAFLEHQREIDKLTKRMQDDVVGRWESLIGPISQAMANRLPGLLRSTPMDEIVTAIEITAAKMGSPGSEYDYGIATKQAKYFHGVLRCRRERREQGGR